MSRRRAPLLGSLAPLLLVAGIASGGEWARGPFPHEKHERLFPVCEGCHAGVVNGAAGELYPVPTDCARCHDGTRVQVVRWDPPSGPRASNLRFSHARHVELASRGGQPAACQTCHATVAGTGRMSVGAPQPARCLGCHEAHPAEAHLAASARCTQCHLPLADARAVSAARIAGFPRPAWHEAPDFLSTHGRDGGPRAASCATCHARETCERCHANADDLPPVTALGRDARVASLEKGKPARYPLPASHRGEWARTHGGVALREGASCANCHTQRSCTACHQGGTVRMGPALAALPVARPGSAPGVTLRRTANLVHPADIANRHGSLASSGALRCASCHEPSACASCHAGADSRAFHVANFVERHAASVFAGSGNCQSCHSTETFCRDCHAQSGVASGPGMNAAFHTGQPMWVLSHGQAARRGIEACASCHRQNDCMRCHSAVGGWRVNPHGPGFPASRLSGRNAESCQWCHSAGGGR